MCQLRINNGKTYIFLLWEPCGKCLVLQFQIIFRKCPTNCRCSGNRLNEEVGERHKHKTRTMNSVSVSSSCVSLTLLKKQALPYNLFILKPATKLWEWVSQLKSASRQMTEECSWKKKKTQVKKSPKVPLPFNILPKVYLEKEELVHIDW